VTLGSGTNAFNNMVGGAFNSGATVNLGAGNTLTNAGTLSPGGTGVMQTTALTGNLAQTAAGTLVVDVNAANGASDRINVSGTANLAGGVPLQVSNLTFTPWQATVLSAAGGTTNNGLIPHLIDQNPCAHWRSPMDMIFQGRSTSVFQA
jgi:hypothetical protein